MASGPVGWRPASSVAAFPFFGVQTPAFLANRPGPARCCVGNHLPWRPAGTWNQQPQCTYVAAP